MTSKDYEFGRRSRWLATLAGKVGFALFTALLASALLLFWQFLASIERRSVEAVGERPAGAAPIAGATNSSAAAPASAAPGAGATMPARAAVSARPSVPGGAASLPSYASHRRPDRKSWLKPDDYTE